MNNPLISVVMPVFNGEKFLKEAIDSILNQTFSDYEFIIINDGSTDRSDEIIRSYSDPRIQYIRNVTNFQLIKTLNIGFECSRGKYIARMDADDISMPDRLKTQVFFMERNPDVGLCSGNAVSIDSQGNVLSKKWWGSNSLPIEWLLIWENPIAHPTVMLRKETLVKDKLFYDDEKLHAEDYELWCQMSLMTNLRRLDDVVLKYRISESSVYSNNFRVSCSNSLNSNSEYVKKIIGKDCVSFHRYFTTFSRALEEKIEIENFVKITEWVDDLTAKFLNLYNYTEEVKSIIFKDSRDRIIQLISSINWKEFLKILLISKTTMNIKIFKIIISAIKNKIVQRLKIVINWV